MFLHVAQKVPVERAGLRFVVEGDGPERDELQALAARLQVGVGLAFVGWSSDPADSMSALELSVLPSHSESGALTSLGAMTLGFPSSPPMSASYVSSMSSTRRGSSCPAETLTKARLSDSR